MILPGEGRGEKASDGRGDSVQTMGLQHHGTLTVLRGGRMVWVMSQEEDDFDLEGHMGVCQTRSDQTEQKE